MSSAVCGRLFGSSWNSIWIHMSEYVGRASLFDAVDYVGNVRNQTHDGLSIDGQPLLRHRTPVEASFQDTTNILHALNQYVFQFGLCLYGSNLNHRSINVSLISARSSRSRHVCLTGLIALASKCISTRLHANRFAVQRRTVSCHSPLHMPPTRKQSPFDRSFFFVSSPLDPNNNHPPLRCMLAALRLALRLQCLYFRERR